MSGLLAFSKSDVGILNNLHYTVAVFRRGNWGKMSAFVENFKRRLAVINQCIHMTKSSLSLHPLRLLPKRRTNRILRTIGSSLGPCT